MADGPPDLERSPSEKLARDLGIDQRTARRFLDEDAAASRVVAATQSARSVGDAAVSPGPRTSTDFATGIPDANDLFRAVFEGQYEMVQKIITMNPALDVRGLKDSSRRTLLYSACRGAQANPEVVQFLLQAGASFKEPSGAAGSLPQHAVVQNFVEMVSKGAATSDSVERLTKILQLLRSFFADMQQQNLGGFTALEEFERNKLARESPFGQAIKAELTVVQSFQFLAMIDDEETISGSQTWRECREYLRKNPLPYLINLNIAELLWKPPEGGPSDVGHIISVTNSALERFCPDTHALSFLTSSMEILVDMKPDQRFKLRIPLWPGQCGGSGGSVLVNWEWRLGSNWIKVDDKDIVQQLTRCPTEIEQHPHKYDLAGFVLRGDGPLDGTILRWLPSTDADLHDDEEDSEEDEDEDEVSAATEARKVAIPAADGDDIPINDGTPPEARTVISSTPAPPRVNRPPPPPPPVELPPPPPLPADGGVRRPRRDQKIDFAVIETKSMDDEDFPLFAMASSMLPVSFSCSDPLVARLYGYMVRIVGEGTADVVASQAGNEEYNPAAKEVRRLTVSRLERVSLRIESAHLASAHIKFVTALPAVIGVKNASECAWDADSDAFQLQGTTQQIRRLQEIIQAFNEVDVCIGNEKSALVGQLRKLFNELKTRIREGSPKLLPEDPVLKTCSEYFKHFRAAWDEANAARLKEFDLAVTRNAGLFIDFVLKVPSTAAQKARDKIGKETAMLQFDDRLLTKIKLDALNRLFESEKPTIPKDRKEQNDTFQKFARDILDRAKSSFALSTILRDYKIHKVCVERNLPFYSEAAKQLLDAVRDNDVTVVRTATGSGKSTLMPVLLLASGMGYNRIAVTQPRRFAAESIQAKIEELHGPTICGFRMAGKSKNGHAPIVYITDGLLRTMLTPSGCRSFDIIVIDEVHERSMEIDACVALLAYCRKKCGRMPKVILSSATFDKQVMQPFIAAGASIADLEQKLQKKFKSVEHYPDEPCAKFCEICQHLTRHHHYIDVVLKLHSMLDKDAQLLCFLPSQKDVTDAVKRLAERNLNAKPLYAQQNGAVQMEYVRTGKVFFSTNIAETSLTFPNLRFVVDVGKVQRPRTVVTQGNVKVSLMETVPAPLSTLRQRSGRVGRTMDGDYVALYEKKSVQSRAPNITPKMELEQYEDLLFSLECQLKQDLELEFPVGKFELTKLDESYFHFPVLGGRKMADAFFAAQTKYNCGEEIFMLAALRMSFQSKGLQDLASKARSMCSTANGDISTIVWVLRRLDAAMHGHDDKGVQTKIIAWCNKNGLTDFSRNLIRTYANYTKMKNYYLPPPPTRPHNKSHKMFARVQKASFDQDGSVRWNGFLYGRKNPDGSPNMSCKENYEPVSLKRCTDFSQVIQALAAGFKTNYFVHCQNLDGPLNYYSRATDLGDGGDSPSDPIKTLSSMHSKSTLAHCKPELPSVIFALDFLLFGAEMPENETPFRLGVISLVERVNSMAEIPGNLQGERWILLDASDSVSEPVQSKAGQRYCVIKGALGTVIEREIELRKGLRAEKKVSLLGTKDDKILNSQIQANLKQFSEDRHIFTPLKFLWSNMYGVKVEVHVTNPLDPYLKITGRKADTNRFEKHFNFWKMQLQSAPMVERPDHFMAVDLYRRPKTFPTKDEEFRERLRNVTGPTLSDSKIFYMCEGPEATRESRMEIVARIAIHLFGCKVCGGFVRDWIVNGERKHLPGPPKDWVEQPTTGYVKYDIKNGVTPKDLDIELSMDKYFDVGRFVSEVRSCGIMVDYHQHIAQRHVFLFERERGPFTADFIEPHFAVLHTLVDFDVNTMCVVAYSDLIGLKMRLQTADRKELTIDSVITHCRERKFITMRDGVDERKKKMTDRGWTELAKMTFIPANNNTDYTVVLVHPKNPEYIKYADILSTQIVKGKAKLLAMYEIRSSIADGHYTAMREEFMKYLGDPNEQDLFHGTKDDAVESILKGGFDDHFWKTSGYFGRGAYFADNPNLSVSFTSSSPRSIFVCSVLLGKIEDYSASPISTPKGESFYPGHGYNSVKGRIVYGTPPTEREMEYIVYRYGQARPKYLLRFDYS